MSKTALDRLVSEFGEAVTHTHSQHGDHTAVVKADKLIPIMRFLREDPQTDMRMLSDLTAVDHLGKKEPRFEVVYHLHSLELKQRLRIKVEVDEDDASVDSIASIWPNANWAEREVWDMFGIRFRNHPDLRRILLYEEFEGHPLRKDYPHKMSQPRISLRMDERRNEPEYYPNFGIYKDKVD